MARLESRPSHPAAIKAKRSDVCSNSPLTKAPRRAGSGLCLTNCVTKGSPGRLRNSSIVPWWHDAAGSHEHDLVAEKGGLPQIVRDDDDRFLEQLKDISNRSFCNAARMSGSRAPSGSSNSNTCGSSISALIRATRCCCPPESCSCGCRCSASAGRCVSSAVRRPASPCWSFFGPAEMIGEAGRRSRVRSDAGTGRRPE